MKFKKVQVLFFSLLLSSCSEDNNTEKSRPKDSKIVAEDQNVVLDSLEDGSYYMFETSNNMKNGEYKLISPIGKLMESGFYYNDSIIGYSTFYDSLEKAVKKKSYRLFGNEFGNNEIIVLSENQEPVDSLSYYIECDRNTFIQNPKSSIEFNFRTNIGYYDSIFVQCKFNKNSSTYKFDSTKNIKIILEDVSGIVKFVFDAKEYLPDSTIIERKVEHQYLISQTD